MDNPVYCRATLNYAGAVDYEPTAVDLYDGRQCLADIDFEQTGFTLVKSESAVSNWRDLAEIERVHVPEIEALSRAFTGCDHAVVYPPLVRSPVTAQTLSDYAPIESVHSDYTEDYRRMVTNPQHTYRGFLAPLLARNGLTYTDVINASRLMVIQFWRNIGDPSPDRPLALCDASTVPRQQMIPILVPEYGGERLDFEAFAVRTPDNAADHAWYTFPNLQANEALAFRTYDSRAEDEGRAFYTPHTAFVDPTVGADAPRRESVEMRALCLFK